MCGCAPGAVARRRPARDDGAGDPMSEIRGHCTACGATFAIPGPPRCVPLDLVGSVVACPACGGAAELLAGDPAGPPVQGALSGEDALLGRPPGEGDRA